MMITSRTSLNADSLSSFPGVMPVTLENESEDQDVPLPEA
jgi:hypothetical protein